MAATLLPGGSEALFIYWIYQQPHQWLSYTLVAALGNSLGGMSNWLIGAYLRRGWQPLKHQEAMAWLQKQGSILLLFSWLPIIGDPLCLAAGWLGLSWQISFLWISLGKLLRYTSLAFIVLYQIDMI